MLPGKRHIPVESQGWQPGPDSRYIGGTTAGVAELADAQDLGFHGQPLPTPTHLYLSKDNGYLARSLKKAYACSPLLTLAHGEVIAKLKRKAGEYGYFVHRRAVNLFLVTRH
jgi:hypothetical protein